ncbi:hypothetical protein D1007_20276 [Hordeum vulgare]|nr:hypothetical protein D1007_20276 [Hordeum vulgare]
MEVMEAKERLPKETKGKAKEKDQAWDKVQSVLNKEEVEEVDFLQPYLHLLSLSLIELLRRMMVGGGRKRKLADYDPYEGAFSDDSEYEYDPGVDVYKGNVMSFTTKEVQKIKAKGVACFYTRKFKKWHCPYCTTKPKPKDGRFDHLLSHVEDVAMRGGLQDQGAACCTREGPDSGVK